MSGESDLLDKLAQSVADGAPIDWKEIDNLPADEELRRLLKLLRVVSEVGEVHRSPADDVSPADRITTKPAADQPAAAPDLHDQGGGLGRWGHLLLLRKIGEGAFGEVYHAHDTWLDHPVALKLFKPTFANRGFSNRVLHEARKLARVRHPNIVSVHGADSHNGQVGFWMDLIEGDTLAELVVAGRLSAGEATYIGHEVCRALAAVHRAEIVHRDVKAQNVMRASDDGRIILMDFGAGEFIKDRSSSSGALGTPLYLAPEIFAGRDASVQSDIYAVGVLLYFLVTGTFPVRGSSVPDLIEAHKRGDRQSLRDWRPDLPDFFVSIVERAIDSDPARRFSSAGQMDAMLTGGSTPGVGPLDIDRLRVGSTERAAVRYAELVGLVIAATVLAIEVLGLIACRVFEVGLGIGSDFTAGPAEYFAVGAYALLPFVVYWVGGATFLGALAGLRPLFQSPLAAIQRRWTTATQALDPAVVATVVFLTGVGGCAAISWAYDGVFNALEALKTSATDNSVDLSILGSLGRPLHRAHSSYSAYLSFLLGLAAWTWFPRMEKRAEDPSRVRLLKWATVAVAFIVVMLAIAPRRFIWEKFEVVRFENQPAFVIGSSKEELLLYSGQGNSRKHWRVRRDAASLQRTGTTAYIFDPQ